MKERYENNLIPQENKFELKFNIILQAGAKIFSEKGYYHANMSDIAKEVGLLKGSLYHYIKSKEELLYHIVISAVTLYIKALEEIMNTKGRADAILEKALIAHMAPMDVNLNMVKVFMHDVYTLSDRYSGEVEAEIARYEDLWIKVIKRGIKEKIFRKNIDPKLTLYSIFGSANWTIRWYSPGGKYSATDIAKSYATNILEGLKIK